jgi:hypothetical protein
MCFRDWRAAFLNCRVVLFVFLLIYTLTYFQYFMMRVSTVLNVSIISFYRMKALRLFSITLFLFITGVFNSTFAQSYLNVNGSNFQFLNSNRSLVRDNGNQGRSVGSIFRYNNVISISGTTVYALVELVEINNVNSSNRDLILWLVRVQGGDL